MNPYRKTFHFDYEFPFTYIYREVTSAQHELPDHVHDWYELVYVHSGKGTFFIDHTFYDAEAGDIFLIPGNAIHRSFPVEDVPKLSSAFYFSASFIHLSDLGDSFAFLQPFTIAKQQRHYRVTLPDEFSANVDLHIEQIHQEASNKQVGYRQAIKLHLQHILLIVHRLLTSTHNKQHRPNYNLSVIPQWMSSIVTYIDSHPQQELGLAALAEQANVSTAHFSRVFKRFTGMNVTDYVNAKRIMLAKELLQSKQLNIADIGEYCGYASIPHFYRKFKEVTGMTPAEYKHLHLLQ